MVEDDGVEISTVIVLDEVLGGVGDLHAACSERLLLQKGLIQGKNHLGDRK